MCHFGANNILDSFLGCSIITVQDLSGLLNLTGLKLKINGRKEIRR